MFSYLLNNSLRGFKTLITFVNQIRPYFLVMGHEIDGIKSPIEQTTRNSAARSDGQNFKEMIDEVILQKNVLKLHFLSKKAKKRLTGFPINSMHICSSAAKYFIASAPAQTAS